MDWCLICASKFLQDQCWSLVFHPENQRQELSLTKSPLNQEISKSAMMRSVGPVRIGPIGADEVKQREFSIPSACV